jgi:hypothetical protein
MTDRMRFTDEQSDGVESRMLDAVLHRAHRRGQAGMEAVAGAGAPSVLREHQPSCILGVTLAAITPTPSHAHILAR